MSKVDAQSSTCEPCGFTSESGKWHRIQVEQPLRTKSHNDEPKQSYSTHNNTNVSNSKNAKHCSAFLSVLHVF